MLLEYTYIYTYIHIMYPHKIKNHPDPTCRDHN